VALGKLATAFCTLAELWLVVTQAQFALLVERQALGNDLV
jgi:hypothetical protein